MPESSILQTAIAAHNAGLCVIPAATDGSKRPAFPWKRYESERPDQSDLIAWFDHHPNLGIVCGAISDRVICLEFEGRFMERLDEVAKALDQASLFPEFKTWINGYSEQTPSGGWHILIHYGGDGPVPGNTKIALDANRETLIETRGEGGFVIVAPSGGTTHPTGKAWRLASGSFENIAWVTPEEYELIVDFLGDTFDECPPAPEPPPPAARPRLTLVTGESWIAEELNLLPSIEEALLDQGWTYVRTEPLGDLWKRPGKDTPGHSARVNANGRLIVFTASSNLSNHGRRTFDALDVILAYPYGRPPTRDERTEYLRDQRRRRLVRTPVVVEAADSPVSSENLWLPPDFWSTRPVLRAIYDEALRSSLSPEGVLGAFLSCYATTVPMSIKLPKIVGAPSPLNTYCALVAKSGGGKSTSMRVAMDLLGYGGRNRHVLLGRSLRSGEGLISLAIHAKGDEETGPIYNNAVQVVFDEGGTLSAQAQRTGSTTISYLNTAWAGLNVVGGALASGSASFPSDLVRICAVMGVQFGVCANLFTGEAAHLGFPQRILFFGLENPVLRTIEVTADDIEDTQPIDVQFWDHGEFAQNSKRITVPDNIVVDVRRWTLQRNAGDLHEDLDSHQRLVQLRTAALFSLMEGRAVLNNEDWEIADAICATSRTIRTQLVRSIGSVTVDREMARGRLDNVRQEAADAAWLESRTQILVGHLLSANGGMTRKELRSKLRNTARPRVDEIIEHGMARGLIVHSEDRFWGGTP